MRRANAHQTRTGNLVAALGMAAKAAILALLLSSAAGLTGCASFFGDNRPAEQSSRESGNEEFRKSPRDLEEAHVQLLAILPSDTLAEIRANSEADMSRYHFSVGMWMRNNWGLWRGGPLASYFNRLGIFHPDDMSAIILDTFWCRLHDEPYRLEERIAFYQEYWRSLALPKEGSPRDGAKIAWVITEGQGKKTVHLGVSQSDRSYWRYETLGAAKIEPATKTESAELDALMTYWAENRMTLDAYFQERSRDLQPTP